MSIFRVAGWLYLYIIVAGIFSQVFVRARLFNSASPLDTMANVIDNLSLLRLGTSIEVGMLIADIIIAIIFYQLFTKQNKILAQVGTSFRLVMVAISAVNATVMLELITFVQKPDLFGSRSELAQFVAQGFVSHNLNYVISLVFFACHCAVIGYLIYQHKLMPKWLGGLMVLAGFCYAINSIALIMFPGLSKVISPQVLIPCLIAELSLAVWLIVRGNSLEASCQRNGS